MFLLCGARLWLLLYTLQRIVDPWVPLRLPMESRYSGKVTLVQATAHKPTCPKCGADIHRSHRRPIERITSLIVPRHRYRCYQCGWIGLRRAQRSPLKIESRGHKVVMTRERVLIIVACLLFTIIGALIMVVVNNMPPPPPPL